MLQYGGPFWNCQVLQMFRDLEQLSSDFVVKSSSIHAQDEGSSKTETDCVMESACRPWAVVIPHEQRHQ